VTLTQATSFYGLVSCCGAQSSGAIGPGAGVSWVRSKPKRRSSTPDLPKLISRQVGYEIPYDDAVVVDLDGMLLLRLQASLAKLVGQSVFVDLL